MSRSSTRFPCPARLTRRWIALAQSSWSRRRLVPERATGIPSEDKGVASGLTSSGGCSRRTLSEHDGSVSQHRQHQDQADSPDVFHGITHRLASWRRYLALDSRLHRKLEGIPRAYAVSNTSEEILPDRAGSQNGLDDPVRLRLSHRMDRSNARYTLAIGREFGHNVGRCRSLRRPWPMRMVFVPPLALICIAHCIRSACVD